MSVCSCLVLRSSSRCSFFARVSFFGGSFAFSFFGALGSDFVCSRSFSAISPLIPCFAVPKNKLAFVCMSNVPSILREKEWIQPDGRTQ